MTYLLYATNNGLDSTFLFDFKNRPTSQVLVKKLVVPIYFQEHF